MNMRYGKENVDVVVPVYKGRQYIRGMITRLEACLEGTDRDAGIRLVLVNDAPKDCLDGDYFSEKIEIVIVETDRNRGIHGARVRGLSYCTGSYVLFLDQDDVIAPGYFRSQLAAMGDADAVVCRAKENGREIYNNTYPFANAADYESMAGRGNAIVSPGQVLMRRKAVPDIWKQNILQNNGADDWFLWICMMRQGCRFALNGEILFEHRLGENSFSWNSGKMLLSEKEMLEVIRRESLLDGMMLEKLECLVASEQERYLKLLEKYRKMFFVYDKWMELESIRGSLSEYLHSQKVRRVTVYGMGYLGRQLVNRLKGTETEVTGAIDRNAGFIDAAVPVSRLEDFRQETDLVIIASVEDTENIVREIRKYIRRPVIPLTRLLAEWEQGGRMQNE